MKSFFLVTCVLFHISCFSQEYTYYGIVEFDENSQMINPSNLEKGIIKINMDDSFLEIYNDSNILVESMTFIIDSTTLSPYGFLAWKVNFIDDKNGFYIQFNLDLKIKSLALSYRDPKSLLIVRDVIYALD